MYSKTLLWVGLALGLMWGGSVWLRAGSETDLPPDTALPQSPAQPAGERAHLPQSSRQESPSTAITPWPDGSRVQSAVAPAKASQPEAQGATSAMPRVQRGYEKTERDTTTRPELRHSGVTVQHQRVSLHVQQTGLSSILHDLAAKTGITVTDHANTQATLMSIDLDNMAVDEALQHVLAAFDVLFLYRGTDAATGKLTAVWIYPKGQGEHAPPGEDSHSTVMEALRHRNPAERAQAYEEIMQHPEWLSPTVIRDGLQDEDAQVRLRMLAQALVTNVVLPADTVEHLALTDPDAQVRLVALSALSFHVDLDAQRAEQIAFEASQDSDPAVQSKAMEIIQHLRATATHESDEAFQTLENEENTTDPGQLAVPVHPQ